MKFLKSLFESKNISKLHSAYGFLLGDMLGAPFEGRSTREAREGYLKKIGSYTDDTLMYLSVLKAFSKKIPLAQTLIELFDSKRGYGNRMDEMLSKKQCHASDSWGNGAATRTAALALFDSASIKTAEAYAKVTHTHPESTKCVQAVFIATRLALKKSKNLSQCWKVLGDKKPLNAYSMGLKADESIPPALIVFEESHSFESTLKNAITLGGDTDSIGALAGALAGAYYGVPEKFIKLVNRETVMKKLLDKWVP